MSLPVSLSPSLNCGYVCATCFKSYNTKGDHRCTKKIECGACRQKECPDFLYAYPRGLKASQRCHDCGRGFFGDTCFEAHRTKTRDGKNCSGPSTKYLFHSTSMRGLFQTGSRGQKHSTSSLRVTWIVLPVTSTSTLKPIAVTFREPSPLKKSKSKKRNENENVDVNEVSLTNEVLPLASKPCRPMRKEKTM